MSSIITLSSTSVLTRDGCIDPLRALSNKDISNIKKKRKKKENRKELTV